MRGKILMFYHDTKGIALFSVMVIMTLFFLLGSASLLSTVTESKISHNYRQSIYAFYDSEAGVGEAVAHIKNNTAQVDQDGDPNWTLTTNTVLFNYRYYTLYDPNSRIYTITSEGKDPSQTANRCITVEVKRLFCAFDIKSPVYCGSGKNKGQPNAIYGDSVCPGWASDGDPNNDDSTPCVTTPNSYVNEKKPLDLAIDQLSTSAGTKVEYDADTLNLVDMANYFRDLPPDRTSLPTSTTETIGSPTDTKVVYINGNQVIAGKLTGYGVLVVTGDLHISGQINWFGVVIVLGNNVVQTGGGSEGIQVTGAILTPNNFEIRGGSKIQWCGDVVRKVLNDAGDPLRIISWRED